MIDGLLDFAITLAEIFGQKVVGNPRSSKPAMNSRSLRLSKMQSAVLLALGVPCVLFLGSNLSCKQRLCILANNLKDLQNLVLICMAKFALCGHG